MTQNILDNQTRKKILKAQRTEITEHYVYQRLSQSIKDPANAKILKQISVEEMQHAEFWQKYSGRKVKPANFKIWWYYSLAKIFGLTFGIKLMENGERKAIKNYQQIAKVIPETMKIYSDEQSHEQKIIALINEEKIKYVGSIVLGLSDALVELTGALAGLTLALANSRLIAMTGLITGIAASLSMAVSEYLSTKSEGGEKRPLKAAVYTGIAYIFTVLFLILPYLIFHQIYLSLALTIGNAIIVIFIFTFYISVAQDLSFKKRFWEMALMSLGIAAITFCIGFVIRIFFGINI